MVKRTTGFATAILMLLPLAASAQDRLPTMPGYSQYERMSQLRQGAATLGSLDVTWLDDGSAFDYRQDGRRWRYTVATRTAAEITEAAAEENGGGRRGGPERGRQFDSADSPEGARIMG
jgi:dipeptidyl-peptidase-4